MLESLFEWCRLRDCGKCVDLIYIDFKKAFDNVSHCKLIHKLTAYGIDGLVLKWIQSFLSNRTQHVHVDYTLLSVLNVCRGVLQGSILSPLLLVVYINNIVDMCNNSHVKLFADDLKIFRKVETLQDVECIQLTLDKILLWSYA